MIGRSNDKTNFPGKFLLIDRHVSTFYKLIQNY